MCSPSIEYWLVGGSYTLGKRNTSAEAQFPTIASNHFAVLHRKLIVNSRCAVFITGQCLSSRNWTRWPVAVHWNEDLTVAWCVLARPTWAGPWEQDMDCVSWLAFSRLSGMFMEVGHLVVSFKPLNQCHVNGMQLSSLPVQLFHANHQPKTEMVQIIF